MYEKNTSNKGIVHKRRIVIHYHRQYNTANERQGHGDVMSKITK